MAEETAFPLGTLVSVRGREWVVEPCEIKNCIKLRPLGGTDDETQVILPGIEDSELKSAVFPPPNAENVGRFEDSAKLLRDALRLKLTNAAGPFRSFGHLAFEPRSYQLVPLLMALKMPVVRLLIADDVGIGKTIEAGLIVKELYERGEISKFVVLCPPHLVPQWVSELKDRFNIDAVGVTARSIASLEKEKGIDENFFSHYPAAVISLDYIKIDKHRDWFKTHIGDDTMLIVDEAHTCCVGGGKQLRFNLLKDLAASEERNIVLLTATPHSGDEEAFKNLLSLLKKEYFELENLSVDHSSPEKQKLREDLGHHLVQRCRTDVERFPGQAVFPDRMTKEITYNLTGEWGSFFHDVREYCAQIAQNAERNTDEYKGKMMWYAALALLRCISSSPYAAKSALTTRLNGITEGVDLTEENAENSALLDSCIAETYDDDDEREATDRLLSPVLDDSDVVRGFIAKAESLVGQADDPKIRCLVAHIADSYKELKKEGNSYRPVIFCKYIATAHYVAEQLKARFPKSAIACVTGEFTNEEREEKVAELSESENRILVATDCLSEGVNLQELFNAVVHYDLAWNPTRHEQREGRVDRFGQQSKKVWCTMLYGTDNPVDGIILQVILRKAKIIKKELGVSVPVPEDDGKIQVALVKAALLKKNAFSKSNQIEIDFGEEYEKQVRLANSKWESAVEKAKHNRTIFAQQTIKPDVIMPEWEKTKAALGDSEDVQRFFDVATTLLNADKTQEGELSFTLKVNSLPREIVSQIAASFPKKDLKNPLKISFAYPPAMGYTFVHRTNPVIESLANYVLEDALSQKNSIAMRAGAYESDAVDEVTAIYLLRIRYQLRNTGKNTRKLMMAEESVAVAVNLNGTPKVIDGQAIDVLLEKKPTGNISDSVIRQNVQNALDFYKDHGDLFRQYAAERAENLSKDHVRVREASALRSGNVFVEPCLPADLIGCYVLVPGGDL